MADINWGLLDPLYGPTASTAPGIQMINQAMAARAAAAEAARKHDEELAFRRDQLAAQENRWGAEDARESARYEAQNKLAQATAARQAAVESRHADAAAGPAFKDARSALDTGDVYGAQAAVAPFGGSVQRDAVNQQAVQQAQGQQQAAQQTQQQELPAFAQQFATLGLLGGGLGSLSQAAAPMAQARTEEQGAAKAMNAEQNHNRFRLGLPSGLESLYDVDEARAAREGNDLREAERVAGILEPAGLKRHAPQASALRQVGATSEEAVKGAIEAQRFEQQQAGADRRASMQRAAAGDRHNDITPAEARAREKEDRERKITTFDGKPAVAVSVIEGAKIRDAWKAAHTIDDGIESLKGHIYEKGTRLIPLVNSTEMAERDAMVSGVMGQLNALFNAGVLNDTEYKRNAAILKPSAWQSPEGAAKVLDTVKMSIRKAYDRQVQSQSVDGQAAIGGAPAQGTPPAHRPASGSVDDAMSEVYGQ